MMGWAALRLEPGRLLDAQLRLLLGNMGTAVLPAIAFTALLSWRMAQSVAVQSALLWWAAAVVSPVIGWIHARYHLARTWESARAPAIIYQLLALNALDGCIWGALSWLCFSAHDGELEVIAAATLTGIAAHNLGQMSAIPQVFLSFLFFEVVAGDLVMLVDSASATRILGIGGLLLVPSFTLQVFHSAKVIRNAILIAMEKDELVQATETARATAVQANATKSVFLAAASHDLRQPIHAQALFLAALSETSLDNAQTELLANARLAASASSELLDALLDFSRIEAGVVVPTARAFSIQEIFYSIDNEAAPLAEAKGLIFRCRETSLAAHSDPALVELILRNLTSNAIKYTDVGAVLLAARRRATTVVLEVWDTGIGIDPKDQQAIFQEFHQLNNPARDRRKGLGLGLAIAKGLAERLGHSLTLQSVPGRGSVFRLQLPLHAAPVPNQLPALVDASHLKGRRVLVLDDDPLALQGMGSLLRTWGMHCTVASTVSEALALAHQADPDLFITDFRLDGAITGAQAIVHVRRTLGRAIAAILVTGDTAPERLREASASAIPLLHKPVHPDELRHCIEQGIRRQ